MSQDITKEGYYLICFSVTVVRDTNTMIRAIHRRRSSLEFKFSLNESTTVMAGSRAARSMVLGQQLRALILNHVRGRESMLGMTQVF